MNIKSRSMNLFGAASITVLIFLINLNAPMKPIPLVSNAMEQKDFLIALNSVASTLLIISIFGMKSVIVDSRNANDWFSLFSLYSYESGFIAILLLVLFLAMSFSRVAVFIVGSIELGWLVLFLIDRYQTKKSESLS